MEKADRNIALDLLRVVIMFMIVLGHSFVHGGILENSTVFSVSYFSSYTLIAFLNVHVNCFVLLSGYFLSSKKFSIKRVVSLWVQVFFWSMTLFFFIHILEGTTMSFTELVKSFLPITQQRYWFMTTYLLMYLLTPLLNTAIDAMSKQQYKLVLLLYFGVFIFLQNLIFWREFTGTNSRSPLFFCFLYLTGAYFRKYPIKAKVPWFLIYVVCSLATCGSRFVLTWLTLQKFGELLGEMIFSGYCSITNVIGAISFFIMFANLKIDNKSKFGKLIVKLSPLTLGVYLIHDHPDVRAYLWNMLNPSHFIGSGYMILGIVCESFLIFSFCLCLEWIRKKVFEICKVNWLTNRIGENLDRFLLKVTEKLES